MARVSTTEGGYGGGASVIHTDASHSEYVSVPDADLLFRGDYHRAGPDLVLTGHDGHHHIIPGYFASEKHAALVAPNGASLSADVVDLLAGSPAPGQYAQAQPSAPPDSIGKVEKIVGDVTVVRNGVSVALHVGDAVFKSDVIATGGDSSAGITFPDGTVLDLVANSRMALNEYSFEPNGANNGAVFTLVEGTFGFVAGQVAHDNHMSVVTPVATMGIRGTAGIVRHEFRANAGDLIYSFLVLDEIDIRRHGHHVGSYEVRDNRPDSPTFGEILRYVADSGYVTYVEPQGSGLPPIVTTEPITNSRLFSDRPILQDLVDSYGQFNPGGIHGPGSGDSPNQLFGPQIFQQIPGLPFTFNPPPPNPNGGAPGATPTVFLIPLPPNPPPHKPPPGPSSNVFIWNGGDGTYPTQNWSQPGVPNTAGDIVEILSGKVVYPAGDNFTIGELIIGPGATLDIQGGTLTVLGAVLDSGMVIVEGDPPTLTITGPTTVMSGGGFTATGSGDEIEFAGNVFNSGSLTASAGGELLFDATVVNEPGSTRDSVGKIISTGTGSTVDFEGPVFNFGTIAATHGGKIVFNGGNVVNEPAGVGQVEGRIVSRGRGSEIDFNNDSVDNFGAILATHHGKIEFDNSALTNEAGAVIKAFGRGSLIELETGSLANFGFMAALDHGTIRLENIQLDNEVGATILAADGGKIFISDLQSGSRNDGLLEAIDGGKIFLNVGGGGADGSAGLNSGGGNGGNFGEIKSIGRHSTIDIRANGGSFDNQDGGTVLALFGGKISLEGDVDNHAGAKIEAIGCDSRVVFSDGNLDNAGFIAAKHDGIIELFSEQVTNEDGAKILADHGAIRFAGGGVDNQSGAKIEAKDHGFIKFESTDSNPISVTNDSGGKITAKDYGRIEFVGFGEGGDGQVVNGGTIKAERHGTVTFDDIAVTNQSGGIIEAKDHGTVIFKDVAGDTNGGLFNDGTIASIGWGSTVDFYHTDINGGTLDADGGKIFVSSDSQLFGPISVLISDYGIVDFANVVTPADQVSVTFSGMGGTLEIDPNSNHYPIATVSGFGVGDTIDLTDLQFSAHETLHFHDGILTITDCGISESFALIGCYSQSDFVLLSDPWGGTEVVFGAVDYWKDHNGYWTTGWDWSSGTPGIDSTAVIDKPVTVTLDDHQQVGNLVIGACAALDIDGGGLTVLNALDDSGQIIVNSNHDDPYLHIDGPVRVETGGSIAAQGGQSFVDFFHDQVGNAGCISASDYGTVTFEAAVWNEGGTIKAWSGGLVAFNDSTVTNEICSTIEANGCSSQVDFSWSSVCNDGRIEAKFGGVVDVSHSTITQGCDGVLAADGCNSQINLDHATVVGGTLETSCGGLIQTACGDSVFDGVTIAWGSNVLVNDQTSLTLQDTIDNHGTITLAAAPDPSLVIDGGVTLTGHGEIVLSGDGDNIVGGACGGVLDNVDNAISGAGSIGDGQLTLINESCGVIDANLAGQTLTIDTDHAVTNKGTLEASNGGTLLVDDAVTGGGSALVAGGVVHFEQAANISEITFNNGGETPTYGEVIFDSPNGLNATVNGFGGTAADLAHSDAIDLAGAWTVESETAADGNLVVQLQDGAQVATLTFDDFTGTLNVGSDGSGGTLITDPPAASHPSPADGGGAFTNVALNWADDQINLAPAQIATPSVGGSVTYGEPGYDNFVFQPGIGADTIANFNARVDTIELDHFANIQNVQQLAALIGTDPHGDAVIELGHNDSITLPGVTQSYLQAHLQSLVHLG